MVKITREDILDRLRKEIDSGRPILGAGCSAGIMAKCAEIGQADIIIVYSTGKSRLMGLPTTIIGNSNPVTLEMYDELANIVKKTPIIAGIEANDIYYLDLERLLKRFLDKGFNGVINFPTTGIYEHLFEGGKAMRIFSKNLASGYGVPAWGWPREVEMIRILHDWDVFTMAYVFTPEDAADMAKAGADCVCAHVGPTVGGIAGFTALEGIDESLSRAQKILDAGRKVNPDVIRLIHGGPFYDPESTKIIYEKTDAQGFVGASAVERVPVEKAVTQACQAFKTIATIKKES
nr:phosphoenolpyruvate hydrolase family protein [Candidatus Freyarchaeota archaeon]